MSLLQNSSLSFNRHIFIITSYDSLSFTQKKVHSDALHTGGSANSSERLRSSIFAPLCSHFFLVVVVFFLVDIALCVCVLELSDGFLTGRRSADVDGVLSDVNMRRLNTTVPSSQCSLGCDRRSEWSMGSVLIGFCNISPKYWGGVCITVVWC